MIGQDEGFSLAEVLIATAIVLAVTAMACVMAVEAQELWRGDNSRIDLHQRARVGADVLTRGVLGAGAGPYAGAAKGPLVRVLAPVMPRRIGLRRPDSFDSSRRDAISVLRAAADAEHAALSIAASPGTATLEIQTSGCRLPVCGFARDTTVLVHDWTGNYDVFTVTGVQDRSLSVRHHGPGSLVTYPADSPVVQVESRTYYFDPVGRTLRLYDGDASDLPLLDDVVGMEVEYYGTAVPPIMPRPPLGQTNCLYDADGSLRASLVPSSGLVPLGLELLADGPWCGSGGNQFDADLLRIRRVVVSVRLQAPDPAVRGSDALRFREPGTARRSVLMVPDLEVVVDISPRNLRGGW